MEISIPYICGRSHRVSWVLLSCGRGTPATGFFSNRFVRIGPAVTEELPHLPDFLDHVEVKVCDDDFILIAAGLGHDFAARIAEVALAVKLANAPWFFYPDAVDGSDIVSVGDRVRGLLQLPKIFAEPGDGGRRIKDDLGAVQAEDASALGKMAVVADVNADASHPGLEHWVSHVARSKVELLPEAWIAVW